MVLFATKPGHDDFLSLTSELGTFTLTAKEGGATGDQFNVGPTAITAMEGFVDKINSNSTNYGAVLSNTLGYYFASNPSTLIVIYRKAAGANTARIYGTMASASIKVYKYNATAYDYTNKSGSEITLPSGDPTTRSFGPGLLKAVLVSGSTRRALATNEGYSWREDTDLWEQTSVPTLLTPVVKKYTFTTDNFSAAATTESITIFALAAGEQILRVVQRHTVEFTDAPSTSLSSAVTSVGIAASATKYGTSYTVSTAPSSTAFTGQVNSAGTSALPGIENVAAPVDIKLTLTTVGVNISALTTGTIQIFIETIRLPL